MDIGLVYGFKPQTCPTVQWIFPWPLYESVEAQNTLPLRSYISHVICSIVSKDNWTPKHCLILNGKRDKLQN